LATAGQITSLLAAMKRGDAHAESHLVELVYGELHALARQRMNRERRDHTLQPTALVNEAYLRLMRDKDGEWKDRAHFFAMAALAMRRVLVDHARSRAAAKRPDARQKVELEAFMASETPHVDQMLMIDEALTRLAALDARQARVVEMIYFGGMTHEQAAEAIGVSSKTVKRDWRDARAWLQAELDRPAQ
jgi:RNA polymerase sigma factor (TIGR02999 family)